jgi:hypothetical protein
MLCQTTVSQSHHLRYSQLTRTFSFSFQVRWDPNREDQMHFEQSAVLYSAYYHLHIMIHRPFIPSPRKPALLSFPSLTICTNAARSCSHVIHAYGKRIERVTPSVIVAAFTSGVYLYYHVLADDLPARKASSYSSRFGVRRRLGYQWITMYT